LRCRIGVAQGVTFIGDENIRLASPPTMCEIALPMSYPPTSLDKIKNKRSKRTTPAKKNAK
jgi:hypothetical protein